MNSYRCKDILLLGSSLLALGSGPSDFTQHLKKYFMYMGSFLHVYLYTMCMQLYAVSKEAKKNHQTHWL